MKLDMRCFQVSQIPAEDSSFEVYVFTFIVITTFSRDSLGQTSARLHCKTDF